MTDLIAEHRAAYEASVLEGVILWCDRLVARCCDAGERCKGDEQATMRDQGGDNAHVAAIKQQKHKHKRDSAGACALVEGLAVVALPPNQRDCHRRGAGGNDQVLHGPGGTGVCALAERAVSTMNGDGQAQATALLNMKGACGYGLPARCGDARL